MIRDRIDLHQNYQTIVGLYLQGYGANAVTAVASICDVVAELIVFNCAAVLPVASSAEIVILYAFDPVRVTKLGNSLSEGSMNPVTSPFVKRSRAFASVTVKSPLTNIASSPRPVRTDES